VNRADKYHMLSVAVALGTAVSVALSGCSSSTATPTTTPTTATPTATPQGTAQVGTSAAPSPTGCNTSAPVLNIGLIDATTGPNALQATVQTAGAELGVSDVNKAGGVKALGGACLAIVHQDGGSTTSDATTALSAVLTHSNVVGIIGTGQSTQDLAVQPILESNQVVMLDTTFSDALTTGAYHYSFFLPPAQSAFDAIDFPAIEALAQSMGVDLKRVGIITSPNPTNVISQKDIENTYAPKFGWNIVIDKTAQIGSMVGAPLSTLVAQIKSAQPQIIFLNITLADDINIQREELAQGMTPPIRFVNGAGYLSKPFIDALGIAGTNGFIATDSVKVDKDDQYIVDELATVGQPYANQFDLGAYSEVWILELAMEAAKSSSGADIQKAIASMNIKGGPAAVEWPCDCVQFGANGRASQATAVLRQWQNGKVVTIYPPQFAEGPAIWPGASTASPSPAASAGASSAASAS
jgi:branched-chain amino acid transport system substrate-binding protein